MAAASYWSDEGLLSKNDEEYLESQAREINTGVLRLQARIRGFLCRVHTGSKLRVPNHLVARQRHAPKLQPIGHPTGIDVADQDQNQSSEIDLENRVDDDWQNFGATLDDPEFAEKKIDDLPIGWLLAYTPDGDPFFFDTDKGEYTWIHPRQSDTTLLFGDNFSLFWAWKQFLAARKLGVSLLVPQIPTIGELAVYWRATEASGKFGVWPGWWRENDPSPDQSLCEVCRHINFDALFHTMNAWGDTQAVPLGSLRSIANKIHCAACRLFTRTAFPLISDLSHQLEELKVTIRCNLIHNQEWTRFRTRIRTVYLELQFLEHTGPSRRLSVGRLHEILQSDEKPPEQKYNDSRLVKNQIDIELIKEWLRTCEQQHQSMLCERNLIYPSFMPEETTGIHDQSTVITQPCQLVPLFESLLELTLIDVEIGCLVNRKFDVRYIALSYVWGGPQPFQNTKAEQNRLYTPGSISREDISIPQTIRDAIKLVQMLGERYLWVDSLCIVQDGMREKREHISNMGNIYSCAVLTLVAAHGSSCHAGLPGVRPGSRVLAQHVEKIGGMLISNEFCYLHEILNGSTWNTRGWTYQERELSRRCLFFTEICVYFSCDQMVWKEDSGLRNVSLWEEKHIRIRAERHPIWNSYRRAVKKFTRRNFTLAEDVLDAFEGIVSLLQPAFKSDFLFGLPETELDVALLWQPKSVIRRRIDESTGNPIFPSWSWAGWVGEVDYVWTNHLLDDLSRLQWQIQGTEKKGEYITSDQLRAPQSGQHRVWEYLSSPESSKGGTPYYYEPKHPDIWCLHPTAPKGARLLRSLLLPGTSELRFKAQTAMLKVVIKPHQLGSVAYELVSPCTYDEHICCPADIISTDGFIAGAVYVPIHIMRTLKSQSYEFICLSRRRGYSGDTIGQNVYARYQNFNTYPQSNDDFEKIPQRATLYPGQTRIERCPDRYDHSRYNKNKPWPLYNIMMIERKDDLAFRVAIGIIHVSAFLEAKPVEKLIVLA